jgi:hypothetical protein
MPEMILARIQRCRYCRREMSTPPLEYQENPYCAVCLRERIGKALPRGRMRWRTEGKYVIAEVSRKRPSNARERH